MWEGSFIRTNLEGIVKVVDGSKTVLKTKSGIRRIGSETENYGQKKK